MFFQVDKESEFLKLLKAGCIVMDIFAGCYSIVISILFILITFENVLALSTFLA